MLVVTAQTWIIQNSIFSVCCGRVSAADNVLEKIVTKWQAGILDRSRELQCSKYNNRENKSVMSFQKHLGQEIRALIA